MKFCLVSSHYDQNLLLHENIAVTYMTRMKSKLLIGKVNEIEQNWMKFFARYCLILFQSVYPLQAFKPSLTFARKTGTYLTVASKGSLTSLASRVGSFL